MNYKLLIVNKKQKLKKHARNPDHSVNGKVKAKKYYENDNTGCKKKHRSCYRNISDEERDKNKKIWKKSILTYV